MRNDEIERLREERRLFVDILNRIENKIQARITSYYEQAESPSAQTAQKKKMRIRWSEASEIMRLIRKECASGKKGDAE